jgi:hypothetical protein
VGMPMHPIIMHGRKEEAETEAEKKKAWLRFLRGRLSLS